MTGEYNGKILSTPTSSITFLTVKVPPFSFPCLIAKIIPSKAWSLVFSPSLIFCQTRTVSPDRISIFFLASISIGEILIFFNCISCSNLAHKVIFRKKNHRLIYSFFSLQLQNLLGMAL